jgi:hypothetical protein
LLNKETGGLLYSSLVGRWAAMSPESLPGFESTGMMGEDMSLLLWISLSTIKNVCQKLKAFVYFRIKCRNDRGKTPDEE